VLRREHVLVSGGWVVKQDRELVLGEGPVLAAIDGLLKIAQRWIRLLGLDAVVTSYVEVITVDVIEVEITRLEADSRAPIPTVVADTPGASEHRVDRSPVAPGVRASTAARLRTVGSS
jgi:hypothetical protein